MAHQFYSEGGDGDEERIPGISREELKALEEERTAFQETEVQMAQRVMRQNLLGAVQSVSKLALYSQNERVRLASAQYIIERNMGRVQDNAPAPVDDPIEALLADVVGELDADDVAALSAMKNSDESGNK